MLRVFDVSNVFCPLRIEMIIMGQMLDYCKMLDQAILNNFHREQQYWVSVHHLPHHTPLYDSV